MDGLGLREVFQQLALEAVVCRYLQLLLSHAKAEAKILLALLLPAHQYSPYPQWY